MIGICEICGGESDRSFGSGGEHLRGHVCCGYCKGILESELLALEDGEPAGKAYDRARIRGGLAAQVRRLKQENVDLYRANELLRQEVDRIKITFC